MRTFTLKEESEEDARWVDSFAHRLQELILWKWPCYQKKPSVYVTSTEISVPLFTEIQGEKNLKIYMKKKTLQRPKAILSKQNNDRDVIWLQVTL